MAENVNGGIDIDALKAEVNGLSDADLAELVLNTKVRSMVAQKKYYNPETAKRARLKAKAKYDEAVELLKKSGKYEAIMAQAKELAEERLAETEVEDEVTA